MMSFLSVKIAGETTAYGSGWLLVWFCRDTANSDAVFPGAVVRMKADEIVFYILPYE